MEQTATLRAEWFAQLAAAIEGAQRLAWQLGGYRETSPEARELFGRLEAARIELEQLQGVTSGGVAAYVPDHDWLERMGWTESPPQPAR